MSFQTGLELVNTSLINTATVVIAIKKLRERVKTCFVLFCCKMTNIFTLYRLSLWIFFGLFEFEVLKTIKKQLKV